MTRATLRTSLIVLTAVAALWAHDGAAQQTASRDVLLATTPIQERVIVRGATVRLGDLFAGLEARTEEPVASAPAPGGETTYDLRRLAALAERHGIAWRPRTWSDKVVVERASRSVPQRDIETALRGALSRYGLGEKVDIEFSGKLPQLFMPAETATALNATLTEYDERSGRFSATIEAESLRATVVGRAVAMTEIPVLTRRIAAGELVGRNDIDWKAVRADQINRQTISDTTALIGQEARRTIAAGQPLRNADFRNPVAVAKNAIVTMTLQTPRMTLTSKGKALDDGSIGDTIRIVNTQSKTVIEGIVTNANTVRVLGPVIDPSAGLSAGPAFGPTASLSN